MKKLIYFILLIGLVVNLMGCNNNDDKNKDDKQNEKTAETDKDNNDKNEDKKDNDEQALPLLEEQKTVEMIIEGMPENKVVKLYHHKELGLSTYVPDDMIVESNPKVFNIYTNFGGTKNENATLKITDQTEEEMIKDLSDRGFKLETQETQAFDFSQKEFSLEKAGMIGRAAIFKHDNKDYALYYYFPEDYADGFGPRSDIIVNEIVWHDEQ
ncbi:MAG TPA: hypothetical protein GX497_09760 [Bacillus bacterium]|nr:hypothetical protein [Bacillus sp. (in: firmicutes)]